MKRYTQDARAEARPEETGRVLALLREKVEEANDAGKSLSKFEPGDVERLGREAGISCDAVGAFRSVVRANFVRLRGRWR